MHVLDASRWVGLLLLLTHTRTLSHTCCPATARGSRGEVSSFFVELGGESGGWGGGGGSQVSMWWWCAGDMPATYFHAVPACSLCGCVFDSGALWVPAGRHDNVSTLLCWPAARSVSVVSRLLDTNPDQRAEFVEDCAALVRCPFIAHRPRATSGATSAHSGPAPAAILPSSLVFLSVPSPFMPPGTAFLLFMFPVSVNACTHLAVLLDPSSLSPPRSSLASFTLLHAVCALVGGPLILCVRVHGMCLLFSGPKSGYCTWLSCL
jgi:hypothetical protein